jgi:membrane associated rhomboid family serine protease
VNAQQVWQSQPLDAPRISLEYIRYRTSRFERGTRFRAGLNYAVCALACGFYGWAAWTQFANLPWLVAAVSWYGLFTLYCIYRLRRHVAAQTNAAEAGVLDTLRLHRRQLERQRDFRRGSWRWQLLAISPGLLLQAVAMYVYSMPREKFAIFAAVIGLGFGLEFAMGRIRSRRSQREIDALDSLAGNR